MCAFQKHGYFDRLLGSSYGDIVKSSSIIGGAQAVKLRHLDNWNARRSKIADIYLSQLSTLNPQLVLPYTPSSAKPIWHLFVIRYPQRDLLEQKLTDMGIGTLTHYPVPPHFSCAYSEMRFPPGSLPTAEELASTVLSLPIGPHLCNKMASRVISAVSAVSTRISQC